MRRVRFIIVFVLLLAAFEFTLLIDAVDRAVVRPVTTSIAAVSGSILRVTERDVRVNGTMISAPCFTVDILNGCNGIEATLFILAAVLAFPASWPMRLTGIVIGTALVQIANLLRVVTLFLIGCHRRAWFDTFHLAIWQTAIFAIAVGSARATAAPTAGGGNRPRHKRHSAGGAIDSGAGRSTHIQHHSLRRTRRRRAAAPPLARTGRIRGADPLSRIGRRGHHRGHVRDARRCLEQRTLFGGCAGLLERDRFHLPPRRDVRDRIPLLVRGYVG